MQQTKPRAVRRKSEDEWSPGQCLCGSIAFEIGVPARWAWHDHSRGSRLAHGAAYATYVGCWKSRFRIVRGEAFIARYEDSGATRSFCTNCGSAIAYERPDAPQMVNVPRALIAGRTGREPLYHVGVSDLQDWTYLGERLVPLKGFPGVFWTRARPKRRNVLE